MLHVMRQTAGLLRCITACSCRGNALSLLFQQAAILVMCEALHAQSHQCKHDVKAEPTILTCVHSLSVCCLPVDADAWSGLRTISRSETASLTAILAASVSRSALLFSLSSWCSSSSTFSPRAMYLSLMSLRSCSDSPSTLSTS